MIGVNSKNETHKYAKFAILYNFSYMAIGAMTPLIGQYLDYIGFSGMQIGMITATGTGVAIIASAFWGGLYSKTTYKHEVLIMLCIMAAFVCIILGNVKEYIVFLIVFGSMYFFQAPIMSLTDAFTVERMQQFGSLRAWGAVGFALGVFLTGIAASAIGISVIFVFYIVSFLITSITMCILRSSDKVLSKGNKLNSTHKDTSNNGSYLTVFRNEKVRNLIICAFFMGGTNVANNTYFSFLYIEGGGTVAGVGIVMLLMVGSEVPTMAWSEKLSRRFTMEKMIFIAMLISVIRFFLYGMGLPWWLLICMSFSQGAVNGILLVEFVRYVSKLAPSGCGSIAVSTYYIIGSNLSTIVCQIVGGFILENIGASGVYIFFGLFNLVGVVLYRMFKFNKPM